MKYRNTVVQTASDILSTKLRPGYNQYLNDICRQSTHNTLGAFHTASLDYFGSGVHIRTL
ncbi:hypothetical protein HMPREF1869_00443 [Bacteroidales bacterium KA00251]|nr:hypothetical protein HMPREF1869_00443 [Bacteroidales bacterium KA00251]